ncbi:hypothetical protein [Mumia zhuanghuii]|uniref:DUF4145 domain-containing protein n=1 Tax=Mumia zhuanghuii TaxID=2585211 RepID=A0A5C4N6I2_9ACTN|nr:hypothetical protein [Mumia zhuanghuii]TNC52578.1 hypothetical protein FHE65_00295 [Mumia zhuanghuii]TNC52688.1 hypothetical protein FHE65_00170 [Mumia zhuanghuii]
MTMRLSDVLSKAPEREEAQVEGFLVGQQATWGKYRTIQVGKVFLTLNCKQCGQDRTFQSRDKLSCLVVSERIASIDVCLRCAACKSAVETWFLVVSRDSLHGSAPIVWLERYVESRRGVVGRAGVGDGFFGELLDRAQRAYEEELGAGAMIYLRKAFETITSQTARASGIPLETPKGKRKSFYDLLKEVDEAHEIVPRVFSGDGYKLFGELSEIIHGDTSEQIALEKYSPCKTLVSEIIRNVSANAEMRGAVAALGWGVAELGAEESEKDPS